MAEAPPNPLVICLNSGPSPSHPSGQGPLFTPFRGQFRSMSDSTGALTPRATQEGLNGVETPVQPSCPPGQCSSCYPQFSDRGSTGTLGICHLPAFLGPRHPCPEQPAPRPLFLEGSHSWCTHREARAQMDVQVALLVTTPDAHERWHRSIHSGWFVGILRLFQDCL